MALMASDKRLYTELLLLYKDFPCLWDNRQVEYSNREAKDHAYDVLLEKFRQIEDGANMVELKKKIEHMRAAYRREHKKVLLSRLQGGEEYAPHLWYYELLTFLNEVSDFSRLEPVPRGPRESRSRDRDDDCSKYDMDDTNSPPPPPPPTKKKVKKRKISRSPPPVYSDQNDSPISEDMNNEEYELPFKNETSQSTTFVSANHMNEWESFGTTVGLQLKDVDPAQRMIAEKLISDVIFDARFNRLTVNSAIVHNSN
ncbi:alcohol dehydrogenase transcription factor myb/SANT-like domain-containing protein [Phthorimaea operculella]|nr:alcohol dehydrogenase transcription factor myb/SANT-like domain-containing protein [Phthorimaea operculella]